MNTDEHLKNIIDELKAALSDKTLELASVRSIGTYWKKEAEKLAKELDNVQKVNEESEPAAHLVTTKA